MRIKEIFNMVKMHENYNEELYKKVLEQNPVLVANLATKEARELYKMQRDVLRKMRYI